MDKDILAYLEATQREAVRSWTTSSIDYHGRLVDASTLSTYLESLRYAHKNIIEAVLSGTNPPASILDIGTGYGLYAVVLQEKYSFKVVATELKENIPIYTTFALKRGIEIKSCDLISEPLPFEADSFDVVIMSEVIEHLRAAPLPIFKEVLRILKPGGLFILTTPNLARLGNILKLIFGHNILESFPERTGGKDYRSHPREYTAEELVTIGQAAGFIDIEIQRQIGSSLKSSKALSFASRIVLWLALLAQVICYFHRPRLLAQLRKHE